MSFSTSTIKSYAYKNYMYDTSDTIFAPITPLGGAVCVIRISGNGALQFLKITNLKILEHKNATLAKLYYHNEVLDEALLTFFQSPHSFTGEDCIEISIHASKYIFNTLLQMLMQDLNFRFADKGEFTYRALLHNKIDAIKAESINSLIRSDTKTQHALSIRGLSGDVSAIYQSWHTKLLHTLSLIEANIDFSDQEIPQTTLDTIASLISEINLQMKHRIDTSNASERIREGFNVAIVGRPNAGKSTLINAIAKRDIVITSPIAGTTRDVIEVKLDINGFAVNLFDTAGIHDKAQDDIEKEGIRRGLDKIENSDIRIFILDAENPDIEFVQSYYHANDIVVMNKIDLAKPEIKNYNCITISAKNNFGIDKLVSSISEKISQLNVLDAIVTSHRQMTLMQNCFKHLQNIDTSLPIEVLSEDIRFAKNYIDQILGKHTHDQELEFIFANFCVGK